MKKILSALIIGLLLISVPAFAADGDLIVNGNVGLGTTTPAMKVDVNGGIRVGTSSATCNAVIAGSIRYNTTGKVIEFCNGTDWLASGSSQPLDTTAPTTTASPIGGTYSSSQSVTLSCNDGTGSGCDKIYYTTDGSTPTIASTEYSSPINVTATTTLKFFAKDLAGNSEVVSSQTYTITSYTCSLGGSYQTLASCNAACTQTGSCSQVSHQNMGYCAEGMGTYIPAGAPYTCRNTNGQQITCPSPMTIVRSPDVCTSHYGGLHVAYMNYFDDCIYYDEGGVCNWFSVYYYYTTSYTYACSLTGTEYGDSGTCNTNCTQTGSCTAN